MWFRLGKYLVKKYLVKLFNGYRRHRCSAFLVKVRSEPLLEFKTCVSKLTDAQRRKMPTSEILYGTQLFPKHKNN